MDEYQEAMESINIQEMHKAVESAIDKEFARPGVKLRASGTGRNRVQITGRTINSIIYIKRDKRR